jgi:3-hydroxybutyryl-CoA dehydrogenase
MGFGKVGVLGCGLMGAGVVETAARAGLEVVSMDVTQELVDKGLARITKGLDKQVAKGRMVQEDRDAILGRITLTTSLDKMADVDIVIEAIIENLDIKQKTWGALDKICSAKTIFASNTSSLKITDQAAATERKDRFVGLHFFNPVPMMKLVEVVKIDETSEETYKAVMDFSVAIGKKPITCSDTTGFVVNRLLVPFLLSAISALEKGIANREDIDKGMLLGCGHPMGPLTLLDFIGLDTVLYIADIMERDFGEPQYGAPQLLKDMVKDGHLGRKSGIGFYDYR